MQMVLRITTYYGVDSYVERLMSFPEYFDDLRALLNSGCTHGLPETGCEEVVRLYKEVDGKCTEIHSYHVMQTESWAVEHSIFNVTKDTGVTRRTLGTKRLDRLFSNQLAALAYIKFRAEQCRKFQDGQVTVDTEGVIYGTEKLVELWSIKRIHMEHKFD